MGSFKQYRSESLQPLWHHPAYRGVSSATSSTTLPQVSAIRFVDQIESEHPSHSSGAVGAVTIVNLKGVSAIRRCGKTALIIAYDEHGGFFDHVTAHRAGGHTQRMDSPTVLTSTRSTAPAEYVDPSAGTACPASCFLTVAAG